MGRTESATRRAVHQHRLTIDGSPIFGIMLGLLVVLPFWTVLALLVWLLA